MAFRVKRLFEDDAGEESEVDFGVDEFSESYFESEPDSDRDYQNQGFRDLWGSWERGYHSPLYVLPTGAGKTRVAGMVIREAVKRGERVCFLADRLLLIEQARRCFASMGMRCGVLVAGESTDLAAPVQLASKDTLASRYLRKEGDRVRGESFLGEFDRIAFDEAHRSGNRSHALLREAFPGAPVLGLTATPILPSGKLLGLPHYDRMVVGEMPSRLVAQGHILPAECYAPDAPDLTGCEGRARGSDYDKKALLDRLCKDNLVGSTTRHWKKLADGMSTLVFCVNRRHAKWLANKYNDARIPSAYVGCETPKEERKRIFSGFERREFLCLMSSDLLTEGVDFPFVECVQLVKPTKSLRLHLQICGRGVRKHTFPGGRVKEKFLFLDHAGCLDAHCEPNSDIPWSLGTMTPEKLLKQGKEEGKIPKSRTCPKCASFHPSNRPNCPRCGHVYKEVVQVEELENQPGRLVKRASAKKPTAEMTPEEAAEYRRKKQAGEWIKALRYAAKVNGTWGLAANIFVQATGVKPWECNVWPLAPKNDWKAKVAATPDLVP